MSIEAEKKLEELWLKVEKYKSVTGRALEEVKITAKKGSMEFDLAEKYLKMARDYFNDGKYYAEKGHPDTALASFSYAHAWIDAGIKAEILSGEDESIFMPK